MSTEPWGSTQTVCNVVIYAVSTEPWGSAQTVCNVVIYAMSTEPWGSTCRQKQKIDLTNNA